MKKRNFLGTCLIVWATHCFAASSRDIDSFDNAIKSLVSALVSPFAQNQIVRVGVLPFTATEKNGLNDISMEGRAIAEKIVVALYSYPDAFVVVDRIDYQKALTEIALSQTGISSETIEIDIGRFMSADYLLSGSISTVMGQSAIRGKVVDVATSEIVSTAESVIGLSILQNSASSLFSEQHNYAVNALFRSMLIPGWGQLFAEQKGAAVLSGLSCGAGLIASVVSGVNQSSTYRDYKSYHDYMWTVKMISDRDNYRISKNISVEDANTHFEKKGQQMYAAYKQKRKLFVSITSATAGLWFLNGINAYIGGNRAQRDFRLYFSAECFSTTLTLGF